MAASDNATMKYAIMPLIKDHDGSCRVTRLAFAGVGIGGRGLRQSRRYRVVSHRPAATAR